MAVAETLTTGLTAAMKTYYKDTFLAKFEEKLVASKMGQAQPVPLNGGKTVDWFRYHPLAKVTAAGSEGDVGAYTYKSFKGHAIQATLETWFDQARFSELFYLTARDSKLSQAVALVGVQAGESIERETIKVLAERCIYPLHGGAITSAGVTSLTFLAEDIAVQSATAASATTIFRLSDSTMGFTTAKRKTNSLKGGWLCVSRGAGYGHVSRITAYSSVFAAAGHSLTLSVAAPEAIVSQGNTIATKVTVASPMAATALLTSAHKMTTPLVQKAEEILFKNGAQAYEDGTYAGMIHPVVYRQLLADPMFQRAMQTGPQFGSAGMRMNEIGAWGKVRFYRMTTAARYAVTSATYTSFSETVGNAYVTFICGRDAYGVVQLEGRGEPELNIKIGNPNDGNTENPNNLYGTAGWKLYWKVVPLNGNFNVGIFTYA